MSEPIPLEDWREDPVSTHDGRVAMAGVFWEMGEPLTDEVAATREYIRRKFGRDDIPPPINGWNLRRKS